MKRYTTPEATEEYARLYGARLCTDCHQPYEPKYGSEELPEIGDYCPACVQAQPRCTVCHEPLCFERRAFIWRDWLKRSDASIVRCLLAARTAVNAASGPFVDVTELATLESLWRYIYSHGSDTPGYRDIQSEAR